jgi:hypothetical protein
MFIRKNELSGSYLYIKKGMLPETQDWIIDERNRSGIYFARRKVSEG